MWFVCENVMKIKLEIKQYSNWYILFSSLWWYYWPYILFNSLWWYYWPYSWWSGQNHNKSKLPQWLRRWYTMCVVTESKLNQMVFESIYSFVVKPILYNVPFNQ